MVSIDSTTYTILNQTINVSMYVINNEIVIGSCYNY